jgi:hypothetical protein
MPSFWFNTGLFFSYNNQLKNSSAFHNGDEKQKHDEKQQKRLKKDKNVLKPTIQRVSTANKKQSQVILDSLIFKNPFFV